MTSGLHIAADFSQCACNSALLIKPDLCLELLREKIHRSGLTLLGEISHEFSVNEGDQYGFTSVLLLAESHVSIHTWPELHYVSVDAYVCNISTDNSQIAHEIIDELEALFVPARTSKNKLIRGNASANDAPLKPSLHLEWLTDTAAFGFTASAILERSQSKYQFLEVLDCPSWGHTLRLDHRYMTSDREGFIYHELMIHPVATAHQRMTSALILGGGDGGALREVLKYSDIQSVDLVEIDNEVIRVAKKYLGEVNGNSFDSPRVSTFNEDAFHYVQRSPDSRYDLTFLDLTDERPPARHLYDQPFFMLLKQKIKPHGAIVLHCGSPYFDSTASRNILERLRNVFAIVRPFGAYIPLYGTYLLFAVASDSVDPLSVTEEQVAASINRNRLSDLRYYDADMHQSVFRLPVFLKKALCG